MGVIMRQLTVRMEKDLLERAEQIAKEQSRSTASVFREALIKFLSNQQ